MTAPSPDESDRRFRIRVSLIDSEPEIWRLIEVDATLTLEAVHEVLQRAMGWRAEHLHMFAKNDPRAPLDPSDRDVISMEMRWYDQESLDEGLPGMLETEWALHHLLSVEAPTAFYEYDFGDGWLHRLDLVDIVDGGPRAAQLLDGQGRAPLEDSGGVHGYLEKLEVLADPHHPEHEFISEWIEGSAGPWQRFDVNDLDIEHVNSELQILHDGEVAIEDTTQWTRLAARMPGLAAGDFRRYLADLDLDQPATVDVDTAARMAEPYTWLLRRVGAQGMTLTGAGWMPPAVVSDAMRDLDWGWRWAGESNRESQTMPILNLRANAQRFGLIRKQKGRLLVSSVGKRLVDDPVGLWRSIARGLIYRQHDEAAVDATILFAIEMARGGIDESGAYRERISYGLGMLGWSNREYGWVSTSDVGLLIREARNVAEEIGAFIHNERRYRTVGVTPEGMAFARAILQA